MVSVSNTVWHPDGEVLYVSPSLVKACHRAVLDVFSPGSPQVRVSSRDAAPRELRGALADHNLHKLASWVIDSPRHEVDVPVPPPPADAASSVTAVTEISDLRVQQWTGPEEWYQR